jgi:hypothetical protein
LLDRSSLAGIRRATGVSENWLSNFIKQQYAAVPQGLNAQTTMPTKEVYEILLAVILYLSDFIALSDGIAITRSPLSPTQYS